MCVNSVHAANRKATARESLELRNVDGTGHLGFYPQKSRSAQPKLVCIRKETEMKVKLSELRGDLHHASYKKLVKSLTKLVGKTIKASFVPGDIKAKNEDRPGIKDWMVYRYNDSLIINQQRVPLWLFTVGLTAEIGQKPKPKQRTAGMKMIDKALREQDKVGAPAKQTEKV